MPAEPPSRQKVSYQEFRVEVLNLSTVRVTRPRNVTLQGTVRWDPLTEEMFKVFTRQLDEGRIKYRQELVVIGSYLYRVLFDLRVAQAFEDDFENVRAKRAMGQVMRLKLEFQSDAEKLARLPWEYLFASDWDGSKGRFIGTEPQLVLTRFVPLARNEAGQAGEADGRVLRILAAVSAPTEEPAPDSSGPEPETNPMTIVDAGPVIKQLTALRDAHPDRFELKTLDFPTQRSLAQCVKDFQPHVVHFIGHGKVEGDEGFLAMLEENEDKKRKIACWVDDVTFASCFRDTTAPRLVFLQACEGARTKSYSAFSGFLHVLKPRE